MSDKSFTQQELSDIFEYHPETGAFTWKPRSEKFFRSAGYAKSWNEKFAGRVVAGVTNGKGYALLEFRRKRVLAHRAAWALVHGEYPSGSIDHIDGERLNNRLTNLRDVSHSVNMRNQKLNRNNKTGFSGIFWNGTSYEAGIKFKKRKIHLGKFSTLEKAVDARKDAEKRLGFHPNHGRVQS